MQFLDVFLAVFRGGPLRFHRRSFWTVDVDSGRASDSFHRPESWTSSFATETGTHSANCAVALSLGVMDVPVIMQRDAGDPVKAVFMVCLA